MVAGGLFTQFFLQDGIRETEAYRGLDPGAVAAAAERLRVRWQALASMPSPSEAETEGEFIFPALDLLGWQYLHQPIADRRRRDVADALLFSTPEAKAVARPLRPVDRFVHGAVIVENEARDTPLDRAPAGRETPASQILRYMSRAETHSNGTLRWGLLTNGRTWRLYYGRVPSRAEGFIGIDVADLLDPPPLAPTSVPDGAPPDHWFRVFLLLFRRDALQSTGPQGTTFLDLALAEGRHYQARVTADLSRIVFERVFPELVAAIARHDPQAQLSSPAWREVARHAAVRLLFRLLFLFFAEDRDLLPVRHPGYLRYALRGLREEAAEVVDGRRVISAQARTWWPRLLALFGAVAAGDTSLGLPPYNGGLFLDEPSDLLPRVTLPDAVLASVIEGMSREGTAGNRRWINYRDLTVQHLGSIYERLLEHDVAEDGAGGVMLRPHPYARKTTGSYYTPEELVRLILRRAVDPLLTECRSAFSEKSAELASDRRQLPVRLGLLVMLDPAERFLDLRICDPAMGSGHFLVSLVDHLTDAILTAMTEANAAVVWVEYSSPLAARIADIRARIRFNAEANGWIVPEAQLDDRHIVRRMVLKRCVFGADLNQMAVELAKLSLWLHSFTVGAPLSFLDHHLRWGDSLFGEFVGPVVGRLREEYGLAISQAVVSAQNAAAGMAMIETLTDLDIAEVEQSRTTFEGVEAATKPLRSFLDLYHAARWLPSQNDAEKIGRALFFGGSYGDPVAIASGVAIRAPGVGAVNVRRRTSTRPEITALAAFEAVQGFLIQAKDLAGASRFLHWEAAFPGVWDGWETAEPRGGFHAVIGNPPWDRIKMQEVEWWATRRPEVAQHARASDRKVAIATLRAASDPMAVEYDRAAARSKQAAKVARFLPRPPDRRGMIHGPYPLYPLFARGDVNLYSLFVERAGRLVRPEGIVGLLVPSGVAADKGAADFFRSINGAGRLGALLDFENRRPRLGLDPFFPDVDSRFKFSAFVHGGVGRTFARVDCAFFQQSAVEAEVNAFAIAPADFALVNPNTGTAPVFRTPRDAEIVLGAYRRLPILVDHRVTPARDLYAIRYVRMFDMTNDSDLFQTAEELEVEGAYPVAGGVFERGNNRFFPLLVGRSVHLFDHRFASVMEDEGETNDPEEEDEDEEAHHPRRRRAANPRRTRAASGTPNVHNPYSSRATTDQQHADPAFIPTPRYWVAETEITERWPEGLDWAIVFRDIARPTDVRTAIACIAPRAAFGNTLPLLLPTLPNPPVENAEPGIAAWHRARAAALAAYRTAAPLLCGNLGSLALDFVTRCKVQSAHLNFYILEQLPMVSPDGFGRRFGLRTAEEIVRDEMLHLTYTADDLAPFARDQGHTGPPFTWDAEDRLRRRARLDAVFLLLYGFTREEAGYVLDSFPILREQEEARFTGRYRTRDLVLRFMAALAAGNPDASVTG